MLKGLGILLILLSGTGLGFSSSWRMRRRLRELKNMQRMALLLENEIGCARTVFVQALARTGGKLEGGCKEFIQNLSRRIQKNQKESLEQMFWEEASKYQKEWCLLPGDLELLVQLGMYLGRESRKVQLEQLKLFQKELEQEILILEKALPAKQKMYQSLGILGGLFLVILVF